MTRISRPEMIDGTTEVPDIVYYRRMGKIAGILFFVALGCLLQSLLMLRPYGWSVVAPYVVGSIVAAAVIPVVYFVWQLMYLENRATRVYADDDLYLEPDDY